MFSSSGLVSQDNKLVADRFLVRVQQMQIPGQQAGNREVEFCYKYVG